MRLSTVAVCLILAGVSASSAFGQSRTRPSAPRRPAPVARPAAPQPAAAPKESADEKIITDKLRAVELEMKRAEQALQRQLAEAEKVRASGLAKSDQALLNRAEALEKGAFTRYEQQMKRLEKIQVPSHVGPAPSEGYRGEPAPVQSSPQARRNEPTPVEEEAAPQPIEMQEEPSADGRTWWKPQTWIRGR